MTDQDKFGCAAGFMLLVGYLLWTQGPVSWFFTGALLASVAFALLAQQFEEAKKLSPSWSTKLMASVAADARKLSTSLTIGFGLVLFLQLWFFHFGTGSDATSYGSAEQKLWELLKGIKAVTSPYVVLAIVLAVFILSSLLDVWRPMAIAAKMKKAVSTTGAVLSAVLMFSFVTPAAVEENYLEATKGVRARLIYDLTEVAQTRRRASAYQWAAATLAEDRRDRALSEALTDYFADGAVTCAVYDGFMREATREALKGYSGPFPPGVRGLSGRFALRRAIETGHVPAATLQQFYPHCDRSLISKKLAKELLAGEGLNLSGHESDELYSSASGIEVPATLRAWVPEFAPISSAEAARQSLPQAVWRGYFRKREKAAEDGRAAEETMRGALSKALSHYVDTDLGLSIEPILESFRDAALSILVKETEGRVRRRLSALRASRGSPAEDLRRQLPVSAFPKSDFGRGGVKNASARRTTAEAVFAAAVPAGATFVEAARAGTEPHRRLIERVAQAQIDKRQARIEAEARDRAETHRRMEELQRRNRARAPRR